MINEVVDFARSRYWCQLSFAGSNNYWKFVYSNKKNQLYLIDTKIKVYFDIQQFFSILWLLPTRQWNTSNIQIHEFWMRKMISQLYST